MVRRRPISRYDCIGLIGEVVKEVFSPVGSRPDWKYSPSLYSPRLEMSDLEVLEKHILKCLKNCKKAVEGDKDIPFVVPQPPVPCSCCSDNGNDGAKDFDENGRCQICRDAGCSYNCVRPAENKLNNYHPGDDAPHGWGEY